MAGDEDQDIAAALAKLAGQDAAVAEDARAALDELCGNFQVPAGTTGGLSRY
jgi:hypothetical protein